MPPAVTLRFLGDDSSLSRTFDKVGGASSAFGSKLATVGKAVAGAFVGAGAAAAAFGAKSAATFAKVGGEVSKLTRYTGDSAEEMSRLRFAANQSGLDVDELGKSLGILSKHLGANDKAAEAMGVTYRDVKGNALPLNKVLLGLADRFKNMPNGIDKNALAMKLFGKAGLNLIPFLNKGKAGLSDLEQAATKFGVVLTQDNLDAVRKNTIAHREFSAAMEGLQVQVGQHVLPVFTRLVTFATSWLLPAIVKVSDLAKRYLAPAFEWAFGVAERVMASLVRFVTDVLYPEVKRVIERIIDVLTPFADKARDAFDRVRTVVMETVLPAIRDHLMPIFNGLVDLVTGRLVPALLNNLSPALAGLGVVAVATQVGDLAGAAAGLYDALALLANPVVLVTVGIAALVAGFVYAYQKSDEFRAIIDERVIPALKSLYDRVFPALKSGFDGVVSSIRANQPQLEELGRAIETVARVILEYVVPAIVRFIADNLVGLILAVSAVIQTFITLAAVSVRVWDAVRGAIESSMHFAQRAIEDVVGVIEAAIRAAKRLADAISHLPGAGIARKGLGLIGDVLGFAEGGIVPGTKGAPQLAIVHGGEFVVPTSGAQIASSGRSGNIYNVVINMPPGSDGDDVVNALTRWSRNNGPVPIAVAG